MSDQQQGGISAVGVLTISIVVVYLGLELYGLHHARERMEPGAVYDEFAGARRAVEVCNPNPPEAGDFERNFLAVTARARGELEARQPGPTPQEVSAELAERRAAREARVDALIEEQGCRGSDVWRLLKLYEARSRLKLRY